MRADAAEPGALSRDGGVEVGADEVGEEGGGNYGRGVAGGNDGGAGGEVGRVVGKVVVDYEAGVGGEMMGGAAREPWSRMKI